MNRIEDLQEVVSPAILNRARDISRLLKDLGVPHVLIGGLAVGIHGHPRATKDVDFMVGVEAFSSTDPFLIYREELKNLVHIGETDIMSVPERYPGLTAELRLEEGIPVISLRGLILMKLAAFRARDQEDVRALLRPAPGRIREVRDYLLQQAPGLLTRLAEVLVG
ncbi:MAG: putative nucleotidyltransferase [Myxococcota bacterium]|jgi:predicted nucleotidyltransferase